jgi:hypothetical protein
MMVYGDYEIETMQILTGIWKAFVRRIDGSPISTAPLFGPPQTIPVLGTNSFYSEEAVLDAAKAMIDRGHIR